MSSKKSQPETPPTTTTGLSGYLVVTKTHTQNGNGKPSKR